MPTANARLVNQKDVLQWRMPIEPSDYPDRDPVLADEERKSIEYLLSLTSGQYREFEHQIECLKRVVQPLLDVLALYHRWRPKSRITSQHFVGCFLGQIVQTNLLYWGWSESTWKTVIDAVPVRPKEVKLRREPGYTASQSPNLILAHLAAYLFAGILYPEGRGSFPCRALGELVFGSELMQRAIDQVIEPWRAAGFTDLKPHRNRFIYAVVLALLSNRNPHLEAITASTLKRLQDMYVKEKELRSRIGQLHAILLSLDLIAPSLTDVEEKPASRLFQDEFVVGIHPQWVAWLRAFWQQTPLSQSNRDEISNAMSVACRWLTQHYPQVTEPSQWTRELALQYVAYVCNEAIVFDYASPVTKQRMAKYLQQRQGEKLTATSMRARIGGVRTFFRCLQKYSYEVNGRIEPRLEISWNPADALATPEHVMAQVQPNPRNVEEEAWLKLVWTACTLNAEMVKEAALGTKMYPLPLWRAVALVWVTGCRRSDEIRRLPLDCIRNEWAPEMVDENGVQLEPDENLWYLLVPTNKYRGAFWTPVPQYTAEAMLAWKAIRPKNQLPLPDRKTGKPTEYLFQYRGKKLGKDFINNFLIPLLCKAAGLVDEQGEPYRDAIGPITSHRARASTAYYLKTMGMSPYDIGKLLGHTNPNKTLPWYLKENLHQLGRMYRKANPLDRTVQALLDTTAAAKGEPCVFYYLADGPDGRPRLCGNPNFRLCYHQLKCAECGAYIDPEMAEVIERRPGCLQIAVSIPLPEQLVENLSKQEAGIPTGEAPPPPPIPSPAFHFNKKVTACIEELSDQPANDLEQLRTRLVALETQLVAKGKQDARNVSVRLLKQEISQIKKRIAELEST
jgi:integrase